VCLAIPGRVVEVLDDANQLALIDVAGVRRIVNVGLLEDDGEASDALVGEWVLIHVGFALSRIDADEARATLELLREMGSDYDEQLNELRASAIE